MLVIATWRSTDCTSCRLQYSAHDRISWSSVRHSNSMPLSVLSLHLCHDFSFASEISYCVLIENYTSAPPHKSHNLDIYPQVGPTEYPRLNSLGKFCRDTCKLHVSQHWISTETEGYLVDILINNIPYVQSSAKLPVLMSSNHLVIRSSCNHVIRSSCYPVIWMSGHLVIWSSGHLVIRSSGHQVIHSSSHLVIFNITMNRRTHNIRTSRSASQAIR